MFKLFTSHILLQVPLKRSSKQIESNKNDYLSAKYCLFVAEKQQPKAFIKMGRRCMTNSQTHASTHTRPDTHSHTDVLECACTLPKKHRSSMPVLKIECKRFIFRPLGPLFCSGFTERMREPPCPLLASVWGWSSYCGPKLGHSWLSVGQHEDGVQRSDDGYSEVAIMRVLFCQYLQRVTILDPKKIIFRFVIRTFLFLSL